MLNLVYTIIYCSLILSYLLQSDIDYENNMRIAIIAMTYPVLCYNAYKLSLYIHYSSKITTPLLNNIANIILASLIINYLQQSKYIFDPTDKRREIIIILSGLILSGNFSILIYSIIPDKYRNLLWIA
jgi:hypothetical protein